MKLPDGTAIAPGWEQCYAACKSEVFEVSCDEREAGDEKIIVHLIEELSRSQQENAAANLRVEGLEKEKAELLSHRLNSDPSKVEWHSPKTVGHLRMQLETLDPDTPVAAVYFIVIDGETVARTTGVQLSWERINNETNRIDQGNEKIPRGLALWAHENDGFGPEVLAYLGRGAELKAAYGIEGLIHAVKQENAALKARVEQLSGPVTEERKRWWHEDVRPIINAIGEISVQEAMDDVERHL